MTENEVFEATQRARCVLRVEAAVLTHWLAGLTAAQSGEALNCCEATVEHLRRHLQLTRAPKGHSSRAREVKLVVEVR